MYKRIFDIKKALEQKSILLLGPRQTGKSTLAGINLPDAFVVNLAESDTFRTYSARPELLRERLPENQKFLVIDEAQLLPEIFNETQVIIDRNPNVRVLLTGSSARKLRRGNINLLPGRVWKRQLHPLVFPEIPKADIATRMLRGGLPGIYSSDVFHEELRNYIGLYLEEEIRSEGLTRSVGDFSRFLTTAALTNTKQVNFTNISNDSGVKLNTVRAYYQILEDTLLGYQLLPFRKTKKRKAVATPKFYFFDSGVVNGILGRKEIIPGTATYGEMFEHLVFLELQAYIDYFAQGTTLEYWRSTSKIEVDFLINESIGIEVKSSTSVTTKDESGLDALSEDLPHLQKIIVCNESHTRKTKTGVTILPVNKFLEMLWNGEIINN